MRWRRGFQIKPGEKVLVCEDVITTGTSVREVIQAVQREGGTVVGVGCLIQRGPCNLQPEPYAVVKLELDTFDPARCPLCERQIPLEKRGSRV